MTMKPAYKKSPLAGYWGGKTAMAHHITPLIDNCPHDTYLELFAGSLAVLFAKRYIPLLEYANDKDGAITDFWHEVMTEGNIADRVSKGVIVSPMELDRQRAILDNAANENPVDVALAVIVSVHYRFGANAEAGHAGIRARAPRPATWKFKRIGELMRAAFWRLSHCQFTQRDALEILDEFGSCENALFYLDPPYVGSDADQGTYAKSGWRTAQFDDMLTLLGKAKAKFVLSEYPSARLDDAIAKHGWHSRQVEMNLVSSNGSKAGRNKTEMLVWNYDAPHYTPERYNPAPLFASSAKV